MKILGIDYGRKKIGLAISDGMLAEPYKVIKVKSEKEAIEKVEQVVSSFAKASKDKQVSPRRTLTSSRGLHSHVGGASLRGKQVSKIIIGVSEGEMAKETRKFGDKLVKKLGILIEYQDETLTTQEAQELSRKAGIKRKKRKSLEDAYSATLILQSYLDSLAFKAPIPSECSTTRKK